MEINVLFHTTHANVRLVYIKIISQKLKLYSNVTHIIEYV